MPANSTIPYGFPRGTDWHFWGPNKAARDCDFFEDSEVWRQVDTEIKFFHATTIGVDLGKPAEPESRRPHTDADPASGWTNNHKYAGVLPAFDLTKRQLPRWWTRQPDDNEKSGNISIRTDWTCCPCSYNNNARIKRESREIGYSPRQ